MATACEFYGADWAGIIELDLELNIWTNGWWHNTDPQIKSLQKLQEFENLMVMPSIVEAIKKQKPIIITDVDDIMKSSPKEYQVYKRLDAQSIMAVPFGPKPMGFLAIRNPVKYMNRTSTLNTLRSLYRNRGRSHHTQCNFQGAEKDLWVVGLSCAQGRRALPLQTMPG